MEVNVLDTLKNRNPHPLSSDIHSEPLVPQRGIGRDFNLMALIPLWIVIFSPLMGLTGLADWLPQSMEFLVKHWWQKGLSEPVVWGPWWPLPWLLVGAGLVHYLRLYFTIRVIYGDLLYGNQTQTLLWRIPVAGFLLAFSVYLLPVVGPLAGPVTGLVAILFPWYWAFTFGKKFTEKDLKGLQSYRKSPWALAKLSLLSLPALIAASELCAALFARWFLPGLIDLGQTLGSILIGAGTWAQLDTTRLYYLVWGLALFATLLYAVLILSFRALDPQKVPETHKENVSAKTVDSIKPKADFNSKAVDTSLPGKFLGWLLLKVLPRALLFMLWLFLGTWIQSLLKLWTV